MEDYRRKGGKMGSGFDANQRACLAHNMKQTEKAVHGGRKTNGITNHPKKNESFGMKAH